jgi:predicted PurR-regulated permease PerM
LLNSDSVDPAVVDDTVRPDPDPDPDPDPVRTNLQMPIDVRSVSLGLLATLASVYALQWAAAVFIPLLLGLLLSYALSPLVDRLQRWHVPRAVGAAALLLAVLGGLGATAWAMADDAAALVESLPDAAQKLSEAVRSAHGAPEGAMQKVQRAAARLEQAAEESGSATPQVSRGVTRVQIERSHFNIKEYLWSGTLGLVGFGGQAMLVCLIGFFLMASGNQFRLKMVRIAGPTFSKKKITLQALDEITHQIHRYLTVQLVTSLGVGIVTWLALLAIGLERAAVWGVAAAVLNLVPYLGSIVVTGGLALVGLLQFGTPGMALLTGGVSLAIHAASGQLVTPWLTSRASRLNPVTVFVGMLAWGWLWGLWGLLLGVPLLMVVKAVCDRVDDLKSIGELLGQ